MQTIHVYPPHDGADNGLAFSRIAVHATDAHTLTLPNFWIGRVYCRPWRYKPKEQPTHLGDSAGTTTSRLPSPTQANQEGELSSGEEAIPTDANTISSLLKAAHQSSTRADMNIGDRDADHGKEATEDTEAKSTDNGDDNDTGDGDDFKLTLSPVYLGRRRK